MLSKKINIALVFTLIFLTACALTPEQKMAREKAKAEERMRIQLALARQCDPKTADLMAKLPQSWELSAEEKRVFDEEYNEKINNPIFQSCYKMAWQAYINQANIELLEQRNMQMQMDNWFWNRPLRCRGWSNGQPYWFPC